MGVGVGVLCVVLWVGRWVIVHVVVLYLIFRSLICFSTSVWLLFTQLEYFLISKYCIVVCVCVCLLVGGWVFVVLYL